MIGRSAAAKAWCEPEPLFEAVESLLGLGAGDASEARRR